MTAPGYATPGQEDAGQEEAARAGRGGAVGDGGVDELSSVTTGDGVGPTPDELEAVGRALYPGQWEKRVEGSLLERRVEEVIIAVWTAAPRVARPDGAHRAGSGGEVVARDATGAPQVTIFRSQGGQDTGESGSPGVLQGEAVLAGAGRSDVRVSRRTRRGFWGWRRGRGHRWGDHSYGKRPRCVHCGRRIKFRGVNWWHCWSLRQSDVFCFIRDEEDYRMATLDLPGSGGNGSVGLDRRQGSVPGMG